MGQKREKFREFRTPFPPRDIRKNPRSMHARVPQVMAQFVLKIELLSHVMGTTPILEMARAYGLRPRFWLLDIHNNLPPEHPMIANGNYGTQNDRRIVKKVYWTIDSIA